MTATDVTTTSSPAAPGHGLAHIDTIRAAGAATIKRRQLTTQIVRVLFAAAALACLIPLAFMMVYAVKRGIGAISLGFFTSLPLPEGVPGTNGISNAILGSLIINGIAIAIAAPIGLLVAIFLIERRGPVATAIRFGADVLTGLPSILIGLFAYTIIVAHTDEFSGISASVALAVLMLPIIIRSNEEAMRNVPEDLWEAGLALGAPQQRVVRSVVIRGSIPGILTGDLLALARAVGETAPLLFTTAGTYLFAVSPFHPLNAIPIVIYTDALTPYKALQQVAWGAAFVLLCGVLLLNIGARVFSAVLNRSTR